MRIRLGLAMIALGMPALAHRLDEYLQGALVSVEKDRIQIEMTLTPGVAVLPFLVASIDANGDGKISDAEQRAYGARVLGDLSLSIDGHNLTPRLRSTRFATLEEMKEGRGEIRLEFDAELPRGSGNRQLTFENRHQSRFAAYQVNCLVPRDPDIRIVAQNRNESQSIYRLDYVQTGAGWDAASSASWWLGGIALLLVARLVYFWRQRVLAAKCAL